MRCVPRFGRPRHGLRRARSCGSEPVPVHSAHVGQVCRVHYRWHAYFGSDVTVFRALQRGDGLYVALERDPGVAVMSSAWVLDAAACSVMTLGSPMVSTVALADLHAVLGSLGFRRDFVDGESTMEAEHDPETSNRTGTVAPAISTEPNSEAFGGGADNRSDGAGAIAAGGCRGQSGGGGR